MFRELQHWRGMCAVIVLCVAPVQAACSQVVSYAAGMSSSWGEKSITLCIRTCGPGTVSSHENWVAPTAGISLLPRPVGPLQLEIGGFLAPKGWSVTTPTLRAVYVEVPVLVHLGYWPRDAGIGFGLTGGFATDLDVRAPARSDVALVAGLRMVVVPRGGPTFSLNGRFAQGFNTIYGLRNHVYTVLLGFSPRG